MSTPAEPGSSNLTRISHDLGALGPWRPECVCFDTARLTRHAGVPGRRRRVGGAAADSPSYFSSLWAPGEARSRRRTRVKQAQNGW